MLRVSRLQKKILSWRVADVGRAQRIYGSMAVLF